MLLACAELHVFLLPAQHLSPLATITTTILLYILLQRKKASVRAQTPPPPLSQALSLQIRWLRLSESPALPCAARFTPLEAKSAVSGRGRFLCCLRQGAQIIGGREGGPLKCDNCSFLHVFKSYFSMPSTPSNNLKPAAGRLLFGKFSSDCF